MSIKSVLFLTFGINIFFIILGLLLGNTPNQYFGKEASFITWVSFFQILTVANFAWKTFKLKREGSTLSIFKDPSFIWCIIALGFVFLSIDEVARIHENMDRFIHKRILHMKETALSDRIDDLIIGVYAFIGLGSMFNYRAELKKYSKSIPLFTIGFVFLFAMIIVELAENRYDFIPYMIHNEVIAKAVFEWCKVLEEVFKLFAEAMFIGAFYYCYKYTKEFLVTKIKLEHSINTKEEKATIRR